MVNLRVYWPGVPAKYRENQLQREVSATYKGRHLRGQKCRRLNQGGVVPPLGITMAEHLESSERRQCGN